MENNKATNTKDAKGTSGKKEFVDITALFRKEEIESTQGVGAINLVFKLYDGNLYALQLCTELSLYHDRSNPGMDETHPLKILMQQNRKGADIVKFFNDHNHEGEVHEKAVERMYLALVENQGNAFPILQDGEKQETEK